MKSGFVILFALLLPVVCWSKDLDRFCYPAGGESGNVCYVSVNTLISKGVAFNGKVVLVTGYFAYSSAPILFASKDDFLSSNTASGLFISMPKNISLAKRLYGLNHQFVTLKGRFEARRIDLMSNGGLIASGRIYDISALQDNFEPWGYYGVPPPPHTGSGVKKRSK